MNYLLKHSLFWFCILGGILVAEQSFVIKKEKKKRSPSMNRLKEQYAQKAGDLIKLIPKIEKHLASIHKEVIADVYDLLDNSSESRIAALSKEQIEQRSHKIIRLTHQVEKFDSLLKEFDNELFKKGG